MKYIILLFMLLVSIAYNSFALSQDTITTKSGLRYYYTHKGSGERARVGHLMIVHYTGTFLDGKKFDSSRDRNEPFTFVLSKGQVIKGWDEGIGLLKIGDRATFIIPYELAYGEKGRGTIPPKSVLIFDVEFLDMKEKSVGMILSDIVYADTNNLNITGACNKFHELQSKNFAGIYQTESDLNNLGYRLLTKAKNPKAALEIMKLNVEAYPESANVYDSIAEVYMELGDTALAIKNYEHSLKLNPKNTNAEEMLVKLREKK
ncbi:MAG: FKBP-type peptidyl-prolyl cis-trans isomerase [Ignavibacteria bacterium]|nr:FKBP-type peptidyl-prolyl cis-trans isomerase [Ignavibacteria bacterium]